MRNTILALSFLALSAACSSSKPAMVLGEPKAAAPRETLVNLMAGTGSPREVRVEGTITDVCRSKGCWLMLSDGKESMRVSVKKCGEVAVPVSSIGKRVAAYGTVERKTISEATAKHYAEESGGDPGKIVGDQVVIAMTAQGIEIFE